MNLQEAYSILELSSSATPEEAKKQYRQLTKQYHPDVNKEEGAEDKFKKINEAYQIVSSGKETNLGSQFTKRKTYNTEHIQVETSISFAESILGCQKDINLNRSKKCRACDGNGAVSLNNGCTKCNGRGQVVFRQGNSIMIQTCDKCGGRSQKTPCVHCNSSGLVEESSTITIAIPGGVEDGNILRLGGMGHFAGNFMMMEQYTDAHLTVHVASEPSLKIEDQDVVCTLQLSLLDALKGCQRHVQTIQGQKEIQIPPMSKNKEEVLIPKLGVSGKGNQRVILHVQYPDDVSKIVDVLKEP